MSSVIIDVMKKCSGCQTSKPRNPLNFGRNKSQPDGLDNYCKPCRKHATRMQYHRDRNPQYYTLTKDQQEAFVKNLVAAYERPHVRLINLVTRRRYTKYRELLKAAITTARNTNDTATAKTLAKHYKSLLDVSPWHVEISFPTEWKVISRALRRHDGLTVYQWLRSHFEVRHVEE